MPHNLIDNNGFLLIWSVNPTMRLSLVRTPNSQKNQYFLPSDTHVNVCVSGCKKVSFSEKKIHKNFILSLVHCPSRHMHL